jgi:hypothetical protein
MKRSRVEFQESLSLRLVYIHGLLAENDASVFSVCEKRSSKLGIRLNSAEESQFGIVNQLGVSREREPGAAIVLKV